MYKGEEFLIISWYLHHISGDTLEGRIHGFAVDENLTFEAPRIDPACQSIQKRRLRWTRRSCNCQQLTLMDVDRHIVQKRLLHCLFLHSCNHLQFEDQVRWQQSMIGSHDEFKAILHREIINVSCDSSQQLRGTDVQPNLEDLWKKTLAPHACNLTL